MPSFTLYRAPFFITLNHCHLNLGGLVLTLSGKEVNPVTCFGLLVTIRISEDIQRLSYRTTLSKLRSSFSSLHFYRERMGLVPSPSALPVEWNPFLLLLASDNPDRDEPVRSSAPGVGVPVWPPFLRSTASPSLWATSFWRELRAIIIIARNKELGLKKINKAIVIAGKK